MLLLVFLHFHSRYILNVGLLLVTEYFHTSVLVLLKDRTSPTTEYVSVLYYKVIQILDK